LHVRKPLDVKDIVLTGRKIQSNSLDPEPLTLTRSRPRRWLESTWLHCLGVLSGRMQHFAREYFARRPHLSQVHSKAYWGMASGCCRCHRSRVHHAGDVSYTRSHRIKNIPYSLDTHRLLPMGPIDTQHTWVCMHKGNKSPVYKIDLDSWPSQHFALLE
jgi:hypothetical protein